MSINKNVTLYFLVFINDEFNNNAKKEKIENQNRNEIEKTELRTMINIVFLKKL